MNRQRHKPTMNARFFRMFFSSSHLKLAGTDSVAPSHGLSYGRRDLYNLVADVNSYPRFVPYCTGSRILEQSVDQDGVATMDVEIMVGFLAFKESYVSRVTCRPYESVQVSSSYPLTEVRSESPFLETIGRGIDFYASVQDPPNNMALPTGVISFSSSFQLSSAPR
jgi:hypothetical protein